MKNRLSVLFRIGLSVILALSLSACDGLALPKDFSVEAQSQDARLISEPAAYQLQLGETQIDGEINDISEGEIIIDGMTLRWDEQSELPEGLIAGKEVSVHSLMLPDNTRYILKVELVELKEETQSQPSSEGKFELYGLIQMINGNLWMVSDQLIELGQGMRTPVNMQVGDFVKIGGKLLSGEFIAHEIELLEDQQYQLSSYYQDEDRQYLSSSLENEMEYEVEGYIEGLDGDTWVINGKSVKIDTSTKMKDGTFEIGDFVKVEVYQLSNGVYLAHEIEKDVENKSLDDSEDMDDDSGLDDELFESNQSENIDDESIGNDDLYEEDELDAEDSNEESGDESDDDESSDESDDDESENDHENDEQDDDD